MEQDIAAHQTVDRSRSKIRRNPRVRQSRRGRPLERVLKPALFALCLLPLAGLLYGAGTGGLGANPIETIIRTNGDWALRLLLITLAVTPLRRLTGWHAMVRLRRMLGLFAFFYASLHAASYLVLDQFFDWPAVLADLLKRPYITVGMVTYLALVPLALTSTDRMIRRLGGRRWRRLHQLIYPATLGAVVHFYMLVKADVREPLLYGLLWLALMAWRVPRPGGLGQRIRRNRVKGMDI